MKLRSTWLYGLSVQNDPLKTRYGARLRATDKFLDDAARVVILSQFIEEHDNEGKLT